MMALKLRTLLVIGLSVAAVLGIAYAVYESRSNPCDSLFEQTGSSFDSKIERLREQGEALGVEDLALQLAAQSGELVRDLQTCCSDFHQEKLSFDQFLVCQQDFDSYEAQINGLVGLFQAAESAGNNGQTEIVAAKMEEIRQAADELATRFQPQAGGAGLRSGRSRGSGSRVVIPEVEPNNEFDQAMGVESGGIVGELSDQDRRDVYQTILEPEHVLIVVLKPAESATSLNLSLYDTEKRVIWKSGALPSGIETTKRIPTAESTGGPLFIVVADGTGTYELRIDKEPQNDAGSGKDAGDQSADSLPVELNQLFTGELGGLDKEDWYRIRVPDGQILGISFTAGPEAVPMKFSLRNAKRNEAWYSKDVAAGNMESKRIVLNNTSGGIYYLSVYDGSGTYVLMLFSQSQDDGGSGKDAGDDINRALTIQPGQSVRGELGGLDEEDWYRLDVPNGHVIDLTCSPGPSASAMKFMLADGRQRDLLPAQEVASGSTLARRVLLNASSGGAYYVRVFYGSGTYELRFTSESQNDANSGTDAGDSSTEALAITPGQMLHGQIGDLDQEDWYSVSPLHGQQITFTLDQDAEAMKVSLQNIDRSEFWYSGQLMPGSVQTFELPQLATSPLLIRVFEGRGTYSMEMR
jgi:hypothetical protein